MRETLADKRRLRNQHREILEALQNVRASVDSVVKLLIPPSQEHKHSGGDSKDATDGTQQQETLAPFRLVVDFPETFKEQYAADQQNNYYLQWRNFRVQRWLCFFTACAVGAAAYYAHIAALQKDTMDKTLESTQRAYLSAGKPEPTTGRDSITLPIENYGHVSSASPTFSLRYTRFRQADLFKISTSVLKVEQNTAVIAPGPAGYTAFITPPPLSTADKEAINSGKEFETLEAIVEYDTGFNYKDRFPFCILYTPRTQTWVSCGHETAYIHMEKAKPERPN